MSAIETNADAGVKEFKVGGKLREIKFTAATRYRLFLNVEKEDIQSYVTSDLFKITAVALLLYGKETICKKLDELMDMFENDNLMDDEMEEIVGWVRQRTLNFMLKEAEEVGKALEQVMPKAMALNNTLTGFQDSASTK